MSDEMQSKAVQHCEINQSTRDNIFDRYRAERSHGVCYLRGVGKKGWGGHRYLVKPPALKVAWVRRLLVHSLLDQAEVTHPNNRVADEDEQERLAAWDADFDVSDGSMQHESLQKLRNGRAQLRYASAFWVERPRLESRRRAEEWKFRAES